MRRPDEPWRAAAPTSGADGAATSARTLAAAADARKGEGETLAAPFAHARGQTASSLRSPRPERKGQRDKKRRKGCRRRGGGRGGHKEKGCEGEEDNKNETRRRGKQCKRAPRNKRRETSRTTAAARGPCGRDPPRPPCWFCGTGAWFARPVVGDLTAKHIFHSKLITASSYLLPRRLPTGYTFTQEKVITALLISLSGSFD